MIRIRRSPPGPKLDANEPDQTAENDFVKAASAAGDFSVSGHLGTKCQMPIIQLGYNHKTSLRQPIGWNRSYRRNGNYLPSEALIKVSASLEHDRLPNVDLRDLLFRNGDFGIDRLELMHFGQKFAFFEIIAETFFEAVGSHDSGNRAANAEPFELCLQISLLCAKAT